MQPEALVKLVGSGNTRTVEEEWMRVAESPDASLEQLLAYRPVLVEICRVGDASLAETLAWAAVEALGNRLNGRESLELAASYLLTIGESAELREQVASLYRQVYADVPELETLLLEAGLEGGRPVRRALQTLDVALNLSEGGFVRARHAEGAARVAAIDREAWSIGYSDGTKEQTSDAVSFADAYRLAEAGDFHVQRCFAPADLRRRLWEEPAEVIVDLCRERNGRIDSEDLEALLVPELIPEEEWKRWWTRARNALKACPNVEVNGRAPYTLTYVEGAESIAQQLFREVQRHREPLKVLQFVETYVKECGQSGVTADAEVLLRIHRLLGERARQMSDRGSTEAALARLVAARVGSQAGAADALEGLLAVLRKGEGQAVLLVSAIHGDLFDMACEALRGARPETWHEDLLVVLPRLPVESCGRAVQCLEAHGRRPDSFEPLVQQIVSAPIEHFDALLWLWDSACLDGVSPHAAPVSLLSRILRALEDARLSEMPAAEQFKHMKARARNALSARRYERFARCLDVLDAGRARALRRQIARTEALAPSVRDQLRKMLDERFPPVQLESRIPPWERSDVLYVTARGYTRKQAEIEEHVNVKMRKNAIAIGQAAEHGDLSENSEYKFALEERDLLRARLAQMNEEFAKAEVLEAGDVPKEHVGVGSRVHFERVTDGAVYDMAFLGPWDADAEGHVFNYHSPLAQGLMGKRVGEVVQLKHAGIEGEYRIVRLSNAVESD